jgi:hypothetical protein
MQKNFEMLKSGKNVPLKSAFYGFDRVSTFATDHIRYLVIFSSPLKCQPGASNTFETIFKRLEICRTVWMGFRKLHFRGRANSLKIFMYVNYGLNLLTRSNLPSFYHFSAYLELRHSLPALTKKFQKLQAPFGILFRKTGPRIRQSHSLSGRLLCLFFSPCWQILWPIFS